MSEMHWKDLKETDFKVLKTLAGQWGTYINDITAQAEIITEDVVKKHLSVEYFESETADDVRRQAELLADSIQDDLHEYAMVKIKATLGDVHDELTACQAELLELIEVVTGEYRFEGGAGDPHVVVSNGHYERIANLDITAALMERAGVKESDFASDFGQNESRTRLIETAEAIAEELTEVLKSIMTRAHNSDDAAAAILRSIVDTPAEQPPPIGATYDDLIGAYEEADAERNAAFLQELGAEDAGHSPEGVHEWWENLSDEERAELLEHYPELVGPVDGIPVEDRNTANRTALTNEIEGLDTQIADLEQQIARAEANGEDTATLQDQLAGLQEDQQSLADLNDRIQEPHPDTGQEYFLLDFGTEGEGQAIVSVGNPDTAANVNVYVPGTGGDLGGAGYDDGGLINRIDAMAFDADRYGTGEETATVLWLGYDAPDNVQDEALDTQFAEDASQDLSQFVEGIRVTAEDEPSNLSMTGHSYGSTAIGVTARDEGLDVDNMIFVGSPGVGVDSAAGLGINPDNVWASRNESDIIAAGMVHGEDPTSDAFGGNTFTSDATREGERLTEANNFALAPANAASAWLTEAIANHSAYWDAGNASRENMAFVVTDQQEKVH